MKMCGYTQHTNFYIILDKVLCMITIANYEASITAADKTAAMFSVGKTILSLYRMY